MKREKSRVGTVIAIVVVIFITVFLVILIWPDSTESESPALSETYSSSVTVTPSAPVSPAPILIAENEHIAVTFEKLYEEEYIQGAAYLTLGVTNNADQEIWVYLEGMSVNDEQLPLVGSGVPMYIKPGKTSRNPFILSYKTLTIESVTEIASLEFDIVVADRESLNEISRISGVKVIP